MALVRLPCPRRSNGGRRPSRRRVNSDPQRLTLAVLRIPEHSAFGAHGVGELDLGAIADVGLNLLPVASFLNFLARGADGKNARQSLHIGESLLQLGDHLILPCFFLLPLADVAAVDYHSTNGGMLKEFLGQNSE